MQEAELKLPVKQFHELYGLLGDLLDYESESGYFNMENLDVDLLEDIRHELYNQIPDEKPTETTYAFTTAISGHYITPLRLYKVKSCIDGSGFLITNDRRSEVYCIEKGCSHLSPDQSENWYLTTITNN